MSEDKKYEMKVLRESPEILRVSVLSPLKSNKPMEINFRREEYNAIRTNEPNSDGIFSYDPSKLLPILRAKRDREKAKTMDDIVAQELKED